MLCVCFVGRFAGGVAQRDGFLLFVFIGLGFGCLTRTGSICRDKDTCVGSIFTMFPARVYKGNGGQVFIVRRNPRGPYRRRSSTMVYNALYLSSFVNKLLGVNDSFFGLIRYHEVTICGFKGEGRQGRHATPHRGFQVTILPCRVNVRVTKVRFRVVTRRGTRTYHVGHYTKTCGPFIQGTKWATRGFHRRVRKVTYRGGGAIGPTIRGKTGGNFGRLMVLLRRVTTHFITSLQGSHTSGGGVRVSTVTVVTQMSFRTTQYRQRTIQGVDNFTPHTLLICVCGRRFVTGVLVRDNMDGTRSRRTSTSCDGLFAILYRGTRPRVWWRNCCALSSIRGTFGSQTGGCLGGDNDFYEGGVSSLSTTSPSTEKTRRPAVSTPGTFTASRRTFVRPPIRVASSAVGAHLP